MRPDMPVIRLAAALLLLPTTAFAAEGMPQLDFANKLTLAQVVWGAIIFVVLYLLLSRWALPQVGGVLATRAAAISGDLDTARAAKAKADAAIAELTDATQRARAEASNRRTSRQWLHRPAILANCCGGFGEIGHGMHPFNVNRSKRYQEPDGSTIT